MARAKVTRKYKQVFNLAGGLRYDVPTLLLDDSQTDICQDVNFRENHISKSKGSAAFASTDSLALAGVVMAMPLFDKSTGQKRLICLTTTNAYYYDNGTSLFVAIPRADSKNIVSGVIVAPTKKNLVCQVTVSRYFTSSKDLVCTVTVDWSKMLWCRVTVYNP